MSARVDGANDLVMLLTETTPRTNCTPAPDLPFNITFNNRFLTVEAVKGTMREKQIKLREPSELEQSMKLLANKAIAEGVPPEKL
jgi:hypothetical protein